MKTNVGGWSGLRGGGLNRIGPGPAERYLSGGDIGWRAVEVSKVHAGGRPHRRGRVAVLVEDVAKGHRKARRGSGGDELLRVGPVALLKARAERVAALEYPVADRDRPRATLQVAAPLGASISRCHVASSVSS